MTDLILDNDTAEPSIAIDCVTPDQVDGVLAGLPEPAIAFTRATGFAGEAGRHVLVPGEDGGIASVLFGLGDEPDPFLPGKLAELLPAGLYAFRRPPPDPRLGALAFALGGYRFTRYKAAGNEQPRLRCPGDVDGDDLRRQVAGVTLTRDLINTAANDLGPGELADAARTMAAMHDASIDVTEGEWLLDKGFPLIHAVGRASDRAPRLIDFSWGESDAPKVTLVGKGVVFDTGGLDIKPATGMALMKKDMGGAANVLGLASMIMDASLKVRLRVLIPAVENAISGNAFRPGDVLESRKGLKIEIGNTDAEGRLVLADALALADEQEPDLIIDLATLTGAARVALGPDVPPVYTDDDAFAADLARHAMAENDPLWRMPLWAPYGEMIKSRIADIDNAGKGGFAGSITAALFLKRFVEKAATWLHGDVYGWRPSARPGQPEGGEAQTIRALYALLTERYGR